MSEDNMRVCPVCGMGHLVRKQRLVSVSKYGITRSSNIMVDDCPVCCAELVDNEGQDVRIALLRDIEKENARAVLRDLETLPRSFASIERACSLPPKTLSKWKAGAANPTAAGIVLINLLYHLPWLCDVIDHDYDIDVIHCLEAMDLYDATGALETRCGYLDDDKSRLICGGQHGDSRESANSTFTRQAFKIISSKWSASL